MHAAIEAYKKDVDRTLLRENLRLTPQQRFEKFEAFMKSVMELHEAGQKHRRNKSLSESRPADQNSALPERSASSEEVA